MDNNLNDNSNEQWSVMLLNQTSPNVQYSFVTKCENGGIPTFIAECKLEDGNTFYGEGRSKQKAKSDAAKEAIKYLKDTNRFIEPTKKRKNPFNENFSQYKPPKKEIKCENNRQNILVAFNILYPTMQFSFTDEKSLIKRCQTEFEGKTYVGRGASKKGARMQMCAQIIQDLYGSEYIETIDSVIYVKKSLMAIAKKNCKPSEIKKSQLIPQGSLQPPTICKGLNPILFLNNLYKTLEYKETFEKTSTTTFNHTVTLEVDGLVFTATANNKKTAKLNCAINAINGLQSAGAMLPERLELAKMNRLSKKKAKYDKYASRNRCLADNHKIRSMMNQGNFKFTSFQKSHTLFEDNVKNTTNNIISYNNNNNNNENSYNNTNTSYNTINTAFNDVDNRYLANFGIKDESSGNNMHLANMNQQFPFMPPANLFNNFYPPYYN